MIDTSILAVFIPTFFLVSVTPGMCMTLALTMGMSVGFRKTLWMMWGELTGVAVVTLATVIGVASLMLEYPSVFIFLKIGGGGYLVFSGIQMWQSKGKMALTNNHITDKSGYKYLFQGFITAIANPKGWAFMISLLPPFINPELSIIPQLSILISIILVTEFLCLILYASGGNTLRAFLNQSGRINLLNRISGTLIIVVGIWLAAF
jgi:homoserine/homoserine lactone efflux protein